MLSEEERVWLETFFMERIFPVLTPLAIDPAHPFPFIANMGQVLALRLLRDEDDRHAMSGMILLPAQVDRFIRLPTGRTGSGTARFMLLEELVATFLDRLFRGSMSAAAACSVSYATPTSSSRRRPRTSCRSYETALKRRRRGVVIHLDVNAEMPATCRPGRRRARRADQRDADP